MKKIYGSTKIGYILLILAVVIMFAGNSSVVYGGLLGNLFKSKTPQFVENIDKVKIGMTKQEVKIWLGDPDNINAYTTISQAGELLYDQAKTPSKKIVSKEVVTDQWYYGSMYKTGNSTGKFAKSLVTNQIAHQSIGMVMSRLPVGALVGVGGHVTQTSMGIAHVAATNAMNPEDVAGTAHAEIYFSNGYVTSKSHNIPIAGVSKYNTTSSQPAVVKNVSRTGGNIKVYSLTDSREFHESACTVLDNAEQLITFPSIKTAEDEGAIAHNCVR